MYALAHWGQLTALFISLAAAGWACAEALRPVTPSGSSVWLARSQWLVTLIFLVCSSILLSALVNRDFSLNYVAEYTDRTLPMFYTVTAFWAGQDGSLLFWALTVALCGAVFPCTAAYRQLPERTKAIYWLLFFLNQAFFLLVLSGWSNPFREVSPAPADGRGLNPLLQNPGMIFHPPLLFLGYAGFTIPACLALAATLTGRAGQWLASGRNWVLFSWSFLSAGIILGGWWSYNELGWGGYWAWDPVENASLIPWLSATAFLHTAIIEERRKSLVATNVFLICLTLILSFFATYVVRSGVIDSLHAFGDSGVGLPLLLFVLGGLLITLLTIGLSPRAETRPLGDLFSRPGALLVASWMLLALGLVIGLGTMWPVISKLWSPSPVGLDANFYNRVCLPLFAILGLLLVPCPWLGWRDASLRHRTFALAVFGAFAGFGVVLFALGVRQPVALVGAAAGLAVILAMILLPLADQGVRRYRPSWGFLGVHLGLALMFLGVAISGPYQQSQEAVVQKGGTVTVGDYTVTYKSFEQGENEAMGWIRARLEVSRHGKLLGEVAPERRIYRHWEQPFAEVGVLPSLGDEIYAVMLGTKGQGNEISLKVSINPLVNWIWIGGTILCLAVFLCFRGGQRSSAGDGQPS